MRELNAKFLAAKEIEELRTYQRNNLNEEVQISENKNVQLKNSIESLGNEVNK